MTEPIEPPVPAKKKNSGCLFWVVGLVFATIILSIIGNNSKDDDTSGDKYSAFDACQTFVKRQLKSQSTAVFPDPSEEDGEVSFSHVGNRWTVVSQVDAQNGFGAMQTVPFTCEVIDRGDQWENAGTTLLEP